MKTFHGASICVNVAVQSPLSDPRAPHVRRVPPPRGVDVHEEEISLADIQLNRTAVTHYRHVLGVTRQYIRYRPPSVGHNKKLLLLCWYRQYGPQDLLLLINDQKVRTDCHHSFESLERCPALYFHGSHHSQSKL